MNIPATQCAPYPFGQTSGPSTPGPTIVPTTVQRQGDRGSGEDADAARRLAVYVRYSDLAAVGIVRNWPTLLRLIREEGFPQGIMLGRNTRAWPLRDVETGLSMRPTANVSPRKAPAPDLTAA
jgi:predicted DNA-binding transcriptional regulator AlpA